MTGLLTDNETQELMIAGGRLKVGDTETQTVELVLNTAPGEWKETPLLGADARRLMGGCTDPFWPGETKRMLRACGVDVKSVAVSSDGTITIE
ncbi:MAG: hypothetical protein HUK01_07125 [Bacteroidaceae bacterium]|nr:hypothetical protein [Bacteroidaceae bacterium]